MVSRLYAARVKASSTLILTSPKTLKNSWPMLTNSYFLIQFADDEGLEPAAFAFFACRFSFSDLLAAVFELFEPPLSLLAMVTSSRRRTGC